jgi:hypothetical protein
MKIVVFDLDETLGYFVEFGIFWDCLNRYLSKKRSNVILLQNDFNDILDLYPEFLRPDIMKILFYLKNKKESYCCDKLMIYTNNQGQPSWANQLKIYFETKINYNLFDQIIAAFKVNGKRIEICRTSHDKSYHDLIKCTKLPLHAEICFIDDNYFPDMHNKNVYYINLKPYVYDIDFEKMIQLFLSSEVGNKIIQKNEKTDFEEFMKKEFNFYNYTCIEKQEDEYKVDTIISKQILIHLNEFFDKSLKPIKKTKTRRSYIKKRNKTHKNY